MFVSSSGFYDAGCSDAPFDAPTGCTGMEPVVSFAKDVGPIFAGCSGEICHIGWKWQTTVNQPSKECCDGRKIVTPFDANASYLVDKIEDHDLCAGSPMPLNGTISSAKVATIVAWICEGAKDD